MFANQLFSGLTVRRSCPRRLLLSSTLPAAHVLSPNNLLTQDTTYLGSFRILPFYCFPAYFPQHAKPSLYSLPLVKTWDLSTLQKERLLSDKGPRHASVAFFSSSSPDSYCYFLHTNDIIVPRASCLSLLQDKKEMRSRFIYVSCVSLPGRYFRPREKQDTQLPLFWD
ncbi:hypothetical protein GGI43DRAFT_292125 [Trichoderma evansii]